MANVDGSKGISPTIIGHSKSMAGSYSQAWNASDSRIRSVRREDTEASWGVIRLTCGGLSIVDCEMYLGFEYSSNNPVYILEEPRVEVRNEYYFLRHSDY